VGRKANTSRAQTQKETCRTTSGDQKKEKGVGRGRELLVEMGAGHQGATIKKTSRLGVKREGDEIQSRMSKQERGGQV